MFNTRTLIAFVSLEKMASLDFECVLLHDECDICLLDLIHVTH